MINPKWILKGDISITDNLAFIQDVLQNNTNPALRIVSMDEENTIPENHPMVVKGTCLLPPIDALIAEADGNEPLYDRIYNDYLNEKFPNQFISALLTSLYMGTSLIIYLPNASSNTFKKFMQLMWKRYGIYPGIIPYDQTMYDVSCVVIWLNMIYRTLYNREKIFDYLRFYPDNALIPEDIMLDLISQLHVYGETVQDKVKEIKRYSSILKVLPNVRPAIVSTMDSDQVAYNNNVNQMSTTFYG